MLFPFDFGFIPATQADDGDPLDVLMLLEDSAPQACVIRARAIGVIEARQREAKGDWERNDRLIAIAAQAKLHSDLRSVKELNPRLLDEIEAFFAEYNKMDGKEFESLKRAGPNAAMDLVRKARERKGLWPASGGSPRPDERSRRRDRPCRETRGRPLGPGPFPAAILSKRLTAARTGRTLGRCRSSAAPMAIS